MEVDIEGVLTDEQASALVAGAAKEKQPLLVQYIQQLYKAFTELYFTYLEINPLGVCICLSVYDVMGEMWASLFSFNWTFKFKQPMRLQLLHNCIHCPSSGARRQGVHVGLGRQT